MSQPQSAFEAISAIRRELERILVGQRSLIDRLLVGLLTGGHVLLEGVPGVAKTLAARSLAGSVGATFRRVQFTPDLIPGHLVGTEVFDPNTRQFVVRLGPLFTEILLADEINRAPAKVQSALLEAMQERQVTVGGVSHPLPPFFFVLATQNPVEHEGTYPLSQAQLDRFLLKVVIGYISRDEERAMLDRMAWTTAPAPAAKVLEPGAVLSLRADTDRVHLEPKVRDYIVDVVRATREPAAYGLQLEPLIELPASPRAGIALVLASKAMALLAGRDYVVPQDVKEIAPDVLRHRLLLSFEAEADRLTTDRVIATVLEGLKVP